jgi:hypothetical protein
MSDSGTYRGLFGAFPYALRASDSRLLRSYVVVGGVISALVVLIAVTGLVTVMAATAGSAGGTFVLSRAFYLVVMLLVLLPLVAPVLLVARRHRVGFGRAGYDRALAATGYLFVLALYVALVITMPTSFQEPVSGALAPVVNALYEADPLLAAVPLAVGTGTVWAAHRRYR